MLDAHWRGNEWTDIRPDVYITKNCRLKTREAGHTVYVVVNKAKQTLGIRCPKWVYDAVVVEHRATAAKRADAVQRRDDAVRDQFEAALTRLFPKAPRDEIPQILKHALQKRSGRVGRTGTVDLEEKVKLAVRAHIRHRHTNYDKLLHKGTSREVARSSIWGELNEIARRWGAQPAKPVDKVQVARRKTKPSGGAKKLMLLPGPRVQTRRAGLRSSSAASGSATEPIEIPDDSEPDVFTLSESESDSDSDDWSEWSDAG